MKITKIGTINNGIDGLEHYFSVVPTEGDTKEQTKEKLHSRYYYESGDLPGGKFISSTHLIKTPYNEYIYIIIEQFDI